MCCQGCFQVRKAARISYPSGVNRRYVLPGNSTTKAPTPHSPQKTMLAHAANGCVGRIKRPKATKAALPRRIASHFVLDVLKIRSSSVDLSADTSSSFTAMEPKASCLAPNAQPCRGQAARLRASLVDFGDLSAGGR